jgi:hypothetical protein
MADLERDGSAQPGSHAAHTGVRHKWNIRVIAGRGVQCALAFSGLMLALYMAGNIPDPGFPDRVMMLLVRVLRYSSLLLCVFSVCSLSFSVRHMIDHPRLRNALSIGFYFSTGILGAALSMLNSFIIAASGGNG